MDCPYRQFSGREVGHERFDAGDHVQISYDITVASGTLDLVKPGRKLIHSTEFNQSTRDMHSFTVEQDGRYRFIVEGERTKRSFLIEWEIAG